MIIDLDAFIARERVHWTDAEQLLDRIERNPAARLDLEAIQRLHFLYQQTSSDLVKLSTFAAERDLNRYLEELVARLYGEIHRTRKRTRRFQFWLWLSQTLPCAFRGHIRAFWLATLVMAAGCAFGSMALMFDTQARDILIPFPQLRQNPADRVHEEETAKQSSVAGSKASFSTMLMTHNTRVSILTLAMGMTYGVGTLTLLFYNGIILGVVGVDYIMNGQTVFLLGWLLPHGTIELPAILIAGQCGLMLAGALIGWGSRMSLRRRLAKIAPDLVTLIFGAALLLVWAGFIESFLSQTHQPVIPYAAKIAFGVTELTLLIGYLSFAGRKAVKS